MTQRRLSQFWTSTDDDGDANDRHREESSSSVSSQSRSGPGTSPRSTATSRPHSPDICHPADPADWHPTKLASLTREEKHRLIKLGPCQPRLVCYPLDKQGKYNRSFHASWYDLVYAKDWLEYSPNIDRMFCFACRMFGVPLMAKGEESWLSDGVTRAHWKNAVRRIREHSLTQYHKSCIHSLKSYLQDNPIDCQLSHMREADINRRQQEIARNRLIVTHLLEIIKFIAMQNLPFRGHDEGRSSTNRGNFLELVHYQAKYDSVLQQHLNNGSRNSTYLSPDIQNQLIEAMANEVLNTIVQQVKDAKFYSILVDEMADIARLEQVSFVLRYLDRDCNIQERFIGVVNTEETSSQTLAQIIFDVAEAWSKSTRYPWPRI